MDDQKLKGVFFKEKSSSHGSSVMHTKEQKRIIDLEIVVQRLQHCLRAYEGQGCGRLDERWW